MVTVRYKRAIAYQSSSVVAAVSLASLAVSLSDASAAESSARTQRILEEVIVTAQKRDQALADVPMTISALPGSELEKRGISNLQELAFAVPELTVFTGNPGSQQLMMRGIGINGGSLPVVGLYLDEVAVDGPALRPLDLRTPDLERVEVLHGPQGTLYGQGSVGGTVKFVTNKPRFDRASLDTVLDATYTSDGEPGQKVTAVANLPLVDETFAMRVAGTYENVGGWIDAPTAGQEDINGGKQYNVRVTVQWNVTDAITLAPMVVTHHNQADSTGNGENADGDLILPPFAPTVIPEIQNDYDLYSLTGTVDFGAMSLLSATSYYENEADGGFTNRFGTVYRSFAFDNNDKVFNQELRLASVGESRLHWTLGAFYRKVDFEAISLLRSGAGTIASPVVRIASLERAKSWSFFSSAGFAITDRLEIGAGARYFTEDKSAPLANGSIQEAEFDSFDPRVYVSFALTDDVKMFVNAAKGFRSGGFNSINPAFPPQFEPEEVRSYELGVKFSAMDSRVRGELSVYHSDYTDMQVATLATSVGLGFTGNVGESRVRGIDGSLQVNVTPTTTLGVGGNWVDTEVIDIPPNSDLIEGDRLNHIPEYNYMAFFQQDLEWSPNVPGLFRIDYSEKGSAVFTSRRSNLTDESDVIGLLNARIGARWKNVSFDICGENLLNDRDRISPNIVNFAARPRPRTLGVQIGASF